MSDAPVRLIGIDLGTTACKAALHDLEGRTLERVVAPYPIDRPAPGRAEQDAASWERAALGALERLEARIRPESVAAIGLTSQVNTHLFVDAAGEPLAPALVWQDVRAADDAAALDATLSTEERLSWWGAPMPIDASHALARMAWTARVRPELWARTARVLLPKDHLLARLTGECASDPLSNVGLVGADGAHVPALLDRVPGAAERLPSLGAPDTIVGRVRPDLPFAGRPVALGTMDAWAGLAGLGAVGDGDGLYLGGTSEILGIASPDAVPTPGVLVMPESLSVRLHVGPTQSGGASLEWAARLLDTDAAGALQLAAAHDPAHRYPLFLPHLDGERAPLWDAGARGLFLGVEAATDRCALARAVLDGVACSARWLLDALEASADRRPRTLRAGGGGVSRRRLEPAARRHARPPARARRRAGPGRARRRGDRGRRGRPARRSSRRVRRARVGGPHRGAGPGGRRPAGRARRAVPGRVRRDAGVERAVRAARGLTRRPRAAPACQTSGTPPSPETDPTVSNAAPQSALPARRPARRSVRRRAARAVAVASALAASLVALAPGAALAESTVAVITPYLAQPGTQFYVEGFEAAAEGRDWTVDVVDTAGDVAAVIGRIEDAAARGVDAIVVNVDPAQVGAGLAAASDAGIPVVGMDAGSDPLLVANVTSNGYAMAAETAAYVTDRLGGEGGVVMFVFDAFPPVQARGVVADAIFANTPDIEVLERVTPDVQDGGISDSRAQMEALLAKYPDEGAIGAVWAAWDQPALGALQAIEAAGREDEGIVVVGMDANPEAREAIRAGGNFEASMAQDFEGIGAAAADVVAQALAGEEIRQSVVRVPTVLVTRDNVDDVD